MRVLVLNSGSSSLKFRFMEVAGDDAPAHTLLRGSITGIGGTAQLELEEADAKKSAGKRRIDHHGAAVQWVFAYLKKDQVEAVGHRVVHGGTRFLEATPLDDQVISEIDQLSELAPLHNPSALAAIRETRAHLSKGIPMVAIFDTAFHAGMPAIASGYAIPHELASKHGIRRYGFHGIAHASLAEGYARLVGQSVEQVRLITLHLGNGCSATAIRQGRSIDTSMGFTPLEGLVMGTRSGDLDPAVVGYLSRRESVGIEAVEQWLNERSGLLGVSGLSNDVRDLVNTEKQGNPRAALALDLFCYRARKYVGAYLAVLEGADAVVFGGGIGEHSPDIRGRICRGMEWCGIRLDQARNAAAVKLSPGDGIRISADEASLPVYVVAVDEESTIARETVRCLI
jgi:acetate kinase